MEQNMNKWIYIESNHLVDAYVVASVLNNAQNASYCMVRRVKFAKLFKNHPAISKSDMFEANDEDQLIRITPAEGLNNEDLINTISKLLGLGTYKNEYIPNLPEVMDLSMVDMVLMMSEEPHEPLDLNLIDIAVKAFKPHLKTIISAGTMAVPCIRGCEDYREIITWEYPPILAGKNRSTLILTNDTEYMNLCQFLGIKSIYMNSDNGMMYANNQIIKHPDELINLINQQIL